MSCRYNSYSAFLKKTWGSRLQKLSIDAGFSCPNRSDDRTKGGCSFCDNKAFNPSYCSPRKSITQQLDEGIEFHEHRYRKASIYLAYFQPYSNTNASLETLKRLYGEALSHPKVGGIVIGTRPDCVDEEKLDYIASLQTDNEGGKRFVSVEYGIESCYDETLRNINRGHDFAATRHAISLTAQRGIHCGAHLVLGFPGEDKKRIIDQTSIINTLPINSLKLHQLQIILGTPLAKSIAEGSTAFKPFALDEYVELVCDILERLRPDIMMERFAGEVPPRYQAFPQYSWRRDDGRLIRNEEIPPMIEKSLERRGTWQGCLLKDNTNKDSDK
ncbi:MAG: TIGR01212 family radical SAM protein [Bacteroidales bacterium]|nr:TIGR01212 family radical SAM protein [Bacteroidales bacterium]